VSVLLIFAVIISAAPIWAAGKGNSITVAVVKDGPSREYGIISTIERELKQLLPEGPDVIFLEDPAFDAGWEPARVRTVLRNALDDPRVDIVLGIGAIVTSVAAAPDFELTKPFVSGFVQRADIPKLPYSEEDHTLKDNFSVVAIPGRVERDLRIFHQLFPFATLHLAVDATEMSQLPEVEQLLAKYSEELGFELKLFPVTDSFVEVLDQMGPEIEAIYLTRMPRLSTENRQELIKSLNALSVPTFSLLGVEDVELGALAGLMPRIERQVARRIALNITQLQRGISTDELPVFLTVSQRLVMNGATAATIDYNLGYKARAYATIINQEAPVSDKQRLDLNMAVNIALENNVELAIESSRVESARHDQKKARGYMLPQIYAGGSYSNATLFPENPILPEEVASVGVSLGQMIYDDRTISNYRSSKRLYEAAANKQEAERLNVASAAGSAYLGFALALAIYDVNAENVQLTEDNLELSKVRFDVGYSGRDEVHRWEAELAQQRSLLLSSESMVETRRIGLDRILGLEQDRQWDPADIEVNASEFMFLNGEINNIFSSHQQMLRFVEFVVDFGINNARELQLYDNLMEAQNIQVNQRKRRWFLPAFSASLYYDYHIDRTPDFSGWRDDTYGLELRATYPIFEGAIRHYEIKRQQSELKTLNLEYELNRQFVEQRIRTSISKLENSFPTIGLSRDAAEASQKNLDVVQDKYSQGLVNVTDLLEAQNQSFQADQNAVVAKYRFLLDLIEFQRSISWFEAAQTEEERQKLIEAILSAVEQ
jgi:outer membrane protein TolC